MSATDEKSWIWSWIHNSVLQILRSGSLPKWYGYTTLLQALETCLIFSYLVAIPTSSWLWFRILILNQTKKLNPDSVPLLRGSETPLFKPRKWDFLPVYCLARWRPAWTRRTARWCGCGGSGWLVSRTWSTMSTENSGILVFFYVTASLNHMKRVGTYLLPIHCGLKNESNFQCCLRIRDVYPGSRILIFVHPGSPIPKTATKEKGKKICCPTFYCTTNITKLNIILFLNRWRKNFGPIYKELQNFLPKNCHEPLNNIGWGSGIQNLGSRDQKGTGSGSATLCFIVQSLKGSD